MKIRRLSPGAVVLSRHISLYETSCHSLITIGKSTDGRDLVLDRDGVFTFTACRSSSFDQNETLKTPSTKVTRMDVQMPLVVHDHDEDERKQKRVKRQLRRD